MKKIALFVFAIAFTTASLRADLQVRAVQQQLREEGFYYGEVNGQPGTETSAAIRRYQIRNGLQVTGSLNQETLDALKIGGSAPAAPTPKSRAIPRSTPARPKPSPSPNVSDSDREFLRQQSGQQEKTTPRRPQATIQPPVQITPQPSYLSSQYAALFARTPFEDATTEVQQRALRDAQSRLLRDRFYNGQVDGMPGAATTRAIALFQDDAGLPRTARLDYETLRELHLLPASRAPIKPFFTEPFDPPARQQPRVYRGIWIR